MTEPLQAATDSGLDRALQDAIAEIRHRLRTPLTLVLAPTISLLESAEVSGAVREDLETIAEQADVLRDDVEDLIELASWPPIRTTEVDLPELVERAIGSVESDAHRRGVELAVTAEPARPVHVDRERMRWVLRTALRRAVLQAGPGDRVVIATSDSIAAGRSTVDVSIGTDRRSRPDLRQHGSVQLALARAVVEHHDGLLRIDDERRVLRIDLPNVRGVPPSAVAEPTATARAPSRERLGAPAPTPTARATVGPGPPRPSTGRERPLVLVVEEDARLRSFLERRLAVAYDVVCAGDAVSGLDAARRHLPDVVVSDVAFPGSDGEAMVHRLHEDPGLPDLAIVIVTGQTEDDVRIRLLRDGADDYVTKPFSIGVLRARIDNLVRQRSDVADLRDQVAATQTVADQLEHALGSRVAIEQAKGILAAERDISPDEAFDLLRKHARASNRKLDELARAVVTGDLRP